LGIQGVDQRFLNITYRIGPSCPSCDLREPDEKEGQDCPSFPFRKGGKKGFRD